MKVEMKFCIHLLIVPCLFLLPFITAEDEATTAGSENVGTSNSSAEDPPESKPEPESQATPETKEYNNKPAGYSRGESTTEGHENLEQENVEAIGLKSAGETTPEAKIAEAEMVAEHAPKQITIDKDDATPEPGETTPETNANYSETRENGTPATAPTLEEGANTMDENPPLKTLSGLTDHDKVKEPSKVIKKGYNKIEKNEMSDETKIVALKEDDNEKSGEVTVPELKEDQVDTESKIETENKDEEQQEVNLVFPTDLVKKDDEFERMAKKIIKPNKELDDALANKLAANWSEHLDHNKEDEQPNIVFESQEKDDKKTTEPEEKIEPETDITDDNKQRASKDVKKGKSKNKKDARMALPTSSKDELNENTTPLETTVLDESVEQAEESKTKKSSAKNKKGHKGEILEQIEEKNPVKQEAKGDKKEVLEQVGDVDEVKQVENSREKTIGSHYQVGKSPLSPGEKSTSTETTKDTGNNLPGVKKDKMKTDSISQEKPEMTGKGITKMPNEESYNSLHVSKKKEIEKLDTAEHFKDHDLTKKKTLDLKEVKAGKTTTEKGSTTTEEETIPQHAANKNIKTTEIKIDHVQKEKFLSAEEKNKPHSIHTPSDVDISKEGSSKSKENKMASKIKKAMVKQRKANQPIEKTVKKKPEEDAKRKKEHEMSEEDLIKHAMKFESLQATTTKLPGPKVPLSPDTNVARQTNETMPEDDGTNVNTTLVFAEIVFRHGDRYKGEDPDETYPNDPYAVEDPFWLPYGCNQIRNKGKMRAFWLGQYLRKRYNGFLGEEYFHNDIRITSADLNRCIDSAHVVGTGLYTPKGINIWNDNVGRFYQPLPVRTLDPSDDIYLNEQVECVPYERELIKVLNKKMKNFNAKYKYVYEYLEMYAGMPVRNLEDVAQIYTTLRIENENGRKLPDWVSLVFPKMLKTLNSYYNQIRFSSHFFKRVQAGPLLTIMLDELKQKSINHLKPNYKIKFWSGFDTTILKLLYTMKETQPSLDKAEELLETDYSGVLMIELHLIKKKHYVKVLYINMDPMFFKSHAPRTVKICDGLSLCPLDTFLQRMDKYRITQKEWYQACNMTYCKVDQEEKIAFN